MIVMQLFFTAMALAYATAHWLTGEPDGWELLMSHKGQDRMAAGWTRLKWLLWCQVAAFDAVMWPFIWEWLTS